MKSKILKVHEIAQMLVKDGKEVTPNSISSRVLFLITQPGNEREKVRYGKISHGAISEYLQYVKDNDIKYT
jgi:hypothetical protein